ncbi:translation initiation factor IF-1 [Candidatus Carsonella ruddii]|uniref:Translation initiation factor IF-1 n=1 Tax=Carsonella ruddii TaxID=114186 RepID=A0AAE7KLI6_CARRU|nr:translation initiation factor IF-1 [Candidatus Carsonella ruddii]AGS06531.1 translation initiation factor IF-1 [Candidatus Carsonella ruddii DC]ALA96791.1 translation initiation factor IF-1 [Candidatus Carsonella ruddii]QLK14012.1 translation initiation factor IF-1 [Candidatus Carsonella ruddii]
MKNKNIFEIEGVVINSMPNATFKIKLENDLIIDAYVSGKIRKNFIKIMIGDKVKILLSDYDLTKGRIIHRL